MKKFLLLAATVTTIAGCNSFTEGDGGTLYRIVEHTNNHSLIKPGDIVFIHNTIKDEADSVISSTYDSAMPSIFMVTKPQYKGDMISTITKLSEGDSAIVKLNADTVFRRTADFKPKGFKGKYYVNTLKILKVFSKPQDEDYESFQNRFNTYLNGLKEKAKADEPIKIKNYITSNKLAVTTTPSGLNYVITKPGSGAKIAVGDSAVVNYTGKLLSGKMFDTSLSVEAKKANRLQDGRIYMPIRILVGGNQVIWDEGLRSLANGGKATFVIPSKLAYGDRGVPQLGIGPFQSLVFDIEVVDVIHPKSTR